MPHEWVDDQRRFESVVHQVAAAEVYALDTEFHRERSYYPRLALLQVAWPGGLVLVDPFAVDLEPLARVLVGPGLAVLHAAEQDLEVLERATGVGPRRLFDTQVAAGFLGFSSPSLAALVARLLSVHLAKGDRLADWTRRPLTADQRSYAASDVEHLLPLHAHLVARLAERGRLDWAEQECDALRRRARGAQEPETAWWRLKDARQLRGRSRGVAQEVAAWRERRAAELDLPPRFVLPDLALSAIAHSPPRQAGDLRSVRGLEGRGLKAEVADQLVAAIRRGQALPPESLRLPPVDELDRSLRPAVALVTAWVAQLAAELEIDAALLATRSHLVSFLRGDEGARLDTGWRRALVGEPVRRLVDGKAALAFDGAELVLEARSHQPVVRDGGAGRCAG